MLLGDPSANTIVVPGQTAEFRVDVWGAASTQNVVAPFTSWYQGGAGFPGC
ncbi:MAG: hypothetical protein ACOYN0_18470 [Phycisphaerales bacterium]